MALDSTYPGPIIIAEDAENIIFGTAQIGDDFGEVQSCELKRTADKVELERNNGSLKACILKNPRFEATFETLFTDEVEAPGLGEQIAFPLVDVVGRILDVSVKWATSAARMLSITASKWDSLSSEVAKYQDANGAWQTIADTDNPAADNPAIPGS